MDGRNRENEYSGTYGSQHKGLDAYFDETDEQEEPDESVEVSLWCFERHLYPEPVEFLFINIDTRRTVGIESHPPERPVLLFGAEEPCCSWRIGHEEEANTTKYDRRCTLDYHSSALHLLSKDPTLP